MALPETSFRNRLQRARSDTEIFRWKREVVALFVATPIVFLALDTFGSEGGPWDEMIVVVATALTLAVAFPVVEFAGNFSLAGRRITQEHFEEQTERLTQSQNQLVQQETQIAKEREAHEEELDRERKWRLAREEVVGELGKLASRGSQLLRLQQGKPKGKYEASMFGMSSPEEAATEIKRQEGEWNKKAREYIAAKFSDAEAKPFSEAQSLPERIEVVAALRARLGGDESWARAWEAFWAGNSDPRGVEPH